MTPLVAGICIVTCLVVIFFALKVLGDSRRMKKKAEEEENSFRD